MMEPQCDAQESATWRSALFSRSLLRKRVFSPPKRMVSDNKKKQAQAKKAAAAAQRTAKATARKGGNASAPASGDVADNDNEVDNEGGEDGGDDGGDDDSSANSSNVATPASVPTPTRSPAPQAAVSTEDKKKQEEMAVKASQRNTTGVLATHKRSRDVHIHSFQLTFHGVELFKDTNLELVIFIIICILAHVEFLALRTTDAATD